MGYRKSAILRIRSRTAIFGRAGRGREGLANMIKIVLLAFGIQL